MSPPVATSSTTASGSANSAGSCASSFITSLDHLDLLNVFDCPSMKTAINPSDMIYSHTNSGCPQIHQSDELNCFVSSSSSGVASSGGGSMLFSPGYNSSASNSSMLSSEGSILQQQPDLSSSGESTNGAMMNSATAVDLFDSFSLDKLNSTFSTNSFYDFFQYGDSLLANYNNMGSNLSEGFSPFGNEDGEESDEVDDECDDLAQHALDQELAHAITSTDENESESDHLVMTNCLTANSEALIAIREIAIRDKKQQQRKHKNSTSSISSLSMSSTIKKVTPSSHLLGFNAKNKGISTFPPSTIRGSFF